MATTSEQACLPTMRNDDSWTRAEWNQPRIVVLKTQRQHMRNFNYLVVDGASDDAVLVDPSWEMDKITAAIADSGAILRGILLTHSHPDHTDLAAPLSEEYECPVWMSKIEIESSGFDCRRLTGVEAESWCVGAMQIQPFHTPGHTPGCLCYAIGDGLFTGDVLFAEGCGICPDRQSAYEMFESLQRLKSSIMPNTRIFPGHSYGKVPGQRFADVVRDNIYLQFSNRENFAAFRLRKPCSRFNVFGI